MSRQTSFPYIVFFTKHRLLLKTLLVPRMTQQYLDLCAYCDEAEERDMNPFRPDDDHPLFHTFEEVHSKEPMLCGYCNETETPKSMLDCQKCLKRKIICIYCIAPFPLYGPLIREAEQGCYSCKQNALPEVEEDG